MKKFTSKNAIQKTIISLIVVILVNFTIPIKSQAAGVAQWAGNTIGQPLMQLVAMLGDVGIGVLHKFVLGTPYMYSSVILSKENPTVQSGDLKGTDSNAEKVELDGKNIGTDGIGIPNIMVCPEYIFQNRIALLDANFIDSPDEGEYTGEQQEALTSGVLRNTISSWYKAFRNLAIVVLLTILVYIGIRILIGSTAQDKAKYKERLIDWLVGLCLVFAMHYIMAGTMMITENVTHLLSNSMQDSTTYQVNVDGTIVKENLTGYIRLMAQSTDFMDSAAYTILYLVLVVFTFMFFVTYLKRVLYMAFFTMIAPLVAMTYPLDKIQDGQAQGFNIWIKEFLMNAIIQPVHLVLYYVFVGSAASLAKDNIIYAIVCIAFLLPAEKFIKKMFRLDKGETTGGLGAVAGGALALKGMQELSKAGSNVGQQSNKNSSGSGKNDSEKIRFGKKSVSDAWDNAGNDNATSETPRLSESNQNQEEQSMNGAGISGEQGTNPRVPNSESQDVEQDMYETIPQWNNGTPQEDGTELQNADQDNNMPMSELQDADQNDSQMMNDGLDDDRTLGQYISDSWQNAGHRTPSQFGSDVKSAFGKTGEKLKNGLANHVSKSPILKSIPTPVKRSIKGVAKMPFKGLAAGGKAIWKHKGKIGRALAKGTGTVMGATLGLAAGVATGDLSKVGTYALGGAMAGRAIGNNTANIAGSALDTVKDTSSSIRKTYEEETYGTQKAKEIQKQRDYSKAKKLYMKDREAQIKAKEMATSIGKGDQWDKIQGKMFDYMSAGVTDDELIKSGIQMEYNDKYSNILQSNSNGVASDRAIALMKENQKSGDKVMTDEKLRKATEQNYIAKYGKDTAEVMMQIRADSLGMGKYYQNIKAKERQESTTTQSRTSKSEKVKAEKATEMKKTQAKRKETLQKLTQEPKPNGDDNGNNNGNK